MNYSDPFGLCDDPNRPECGDDRLEKVFKKLSDFTDRVEVKIAAAIGGLLGEATGIFDAMRFTSGKDTDGRKLGRIERLTAGVMAAAGATGGAEDDILKFGISRHLRLLRRARHIICTYTAKGGHSRSTQRTH